MAESIILLSWSSKAYYSRIFWRTQTMSSTSILRRRFLGTRASSSFPVAPLLRLSFWVFSSLRAFWSWVICLSFAAMDVWFASKLLLARVSNRLYFETRSSVWTSDSSDIIRYKLSIRMHWVSDDIQNLRLYRFRDYWDFPRLIHATIILLPWRDSTFQLDCCKVVLIVAHVSAKAVIIGNSSEIMKSLRWFRQFSQRQFIFPWMKLENKPKNLET